MKSSKSILLIASSLLLISLSACSKDDNKAIASKEPAITSTEKGTETVKGLAGMSSEQKQVSYMIGMDIAKSLEEINNDIDPELLSKGLSDQLKGKPLLTEAQHKQVREAFTVKLQAHATKIAAELPAKNAKQGAEFLAKNKTAVGVVTTASGLQYQVLRQGSGAKPSATSIVKVHYKGSLLDGKVFDSSYDRNEPIEFPLNQVIPGWTEGVSLMAIGSKYKFWIPADIAYAEGGNPPLIGPNATLEFEIELIEIKAAQ